MSDAVHDPAAPQPLISAPSPARRAGLSAAMSQLTLLRQQGRPAELAQACSQVAHWLCQNGDALSAVQYLQEALHWNSRVGSGGAAARADLLCRLAEMACEAADWQDRGADDEPTAARADRGPARDLAREAVMLPDGSADAPWTAKLLLRCAEVLERCGEHADALRLQTRALNLCGHHQPDAMTGERAARPGAHLMPAPRQLM